jgi:carboxyl-terminal processing protease
VSRGVHTVVAVAAGAVLGAGLMLIRGVSAHRDPVAASPAPLPLHEPGTLLDEVSAYVREDYVDPVTEPQLERAAAQGMVGSLDPHSAFLDAAQYQSMRVSTSGHYSGVGLEVAEQDGRVVVVNPFDDSPAQRAGVRAGDVLLAVDGQPVERGNLDAVIDRMRGFIGSKVRLAVARDGEPRPLQFELERSEVHVRTVRAEPLPGHYGYVRVSHFSDATPADFRRALATLQSSGRLAGWVLDLRGNPGGVLESAVDVADQFLDAGLIVRAVGRTPESCFEMRATPGDAIDRAPLVVLVDHGSASGAEIVAGALRDHRRATLIGERTFGKGSVQTVLPLRDGQALKLTTSRYFTPSGASIHDKGIEPDVRLDDPSPGAGADRDTAGDPAIEAAVQYLRDRSLVGAHVASIAGQ